MTQLALPFHAAIARDVIRHTEYLQHARLCLAVVLEDGNVVMADSLVSEVWT